MGTLNDKVQFEEVEEEEQEEKENKKGYRIFSHDYTMAKKDSSEQICSLPKCQCPEMNHYIPVDFKLCTVCTNKKYKNFRKMDENMKMDYQKNKSVANHLSKPFHQAPFLYVKKEDQIVSQPPTPYYYNAWSLPIQKCEAQRTTKPTTQTNYTTNLNQDSVHHSSHPPSQSSRPHSPHSPLVPPRPVPLYDYDKVDTKNKFQNLFLHDKYKI